MTGFASSAAAETRYVTDDQGRVVLETRDDGTRITYSYSPDGRVIKTNLADGSQVEVDAAGTEATSDAP